MNLKGKINNTSKNESYILIVGPSNVRGGVTTVIKSHMAILKKANIPFINIDTSAYYSGRKGKNLIILIRAIYKILSLNKSPAGIHIHLSAGRGFYRKFFLIHLLKLKFRQTPIISHIHYGFFPSWASKIIHKPWVIKTFKYSNAVIVNIPFFKNKLEDIFPSVQDKIHILPNKIPFAPPEEIPSKSLEKPYHIFYLGYLKYIKSSQFLLGAIKKVCENNLPFKFTLAGAGGDTFLVDKAKKLSRKYPEKVEYKAWITDEQKKELFSTADFFIQPSSSESFSIVTYEAMAWGLPVIAVRERGPAYLLNDNGALWIKPDSVKSIYDTLLEISNNEISYNSLSKANRERSFKLYNYPVSDKLLKIYKLIFR